MVDYCIHWGVPKHIRAAQSWVDDMNENRGESHYVLAPCPGDPTMGMDAYFDRMRGVYDDLRRYRCCRGVKKWHPYEDAKRDVDYLNEICPAVRHVLEWSPGAPMKARVVCLYRMSEDQDGRPGAPKSILPGPPKSILEMYLDSDLSLAIDRYKYKLTRRERKLLKEKIKKFLACFDAPEPLWFLQLSLADRFGLLKSLHNYGCDLSWFLDVSARFSRYKSFLQHIRKVDVDEPLTIEAVDMILYAALYFYGSTRRCAWNWQKDLS